MISIVLASVFLKKKKSFLVEIFLSECLIEILKLKFDQDLCGNFDMSSTLGSVVPLAMFISVQAIRFGLTWTFMLGYNGQNFVHTNRGGIRFGRRPQYKTNLDKI